MAETAEKIVPLPSGKTEYLATLQPLMGFVVERIDVGVKDASGNRVVGQTRAMWKLNLMGGSLFIDEPAAGIEPGVYRSGTMELTFRSGKNGGEFRPGKLITATR